MTRDVDYVEATRRLQNGYLEDQLRTQRLRDQRLADREQRTLARAGHSQTRLPERPRSTGTRSADRLVADFDQRQTELRKERERERLRAIRAGRKAAAEAEANSYDRRTSAEKLLGFS